MKKIYISICLTILSFCGFSQWVQQNPFLPINGSKRLWSVISSDINTSYIVGNNGTILKTTSGGISWTKQISGTTVNLFAAYFVNENTGYIVGGNGIILKTINGGINWTSQTSGTTSNLESIYFINANTGYIGGEGLLLKTTNGGNNWNIQLNGLSYKVLSIYFVDANTGYFCGSGVNNKVIMKTTDGGNSWNEIFSEITSVTQYLESIFFTNLNTGYVVGWSGIIKKTTDGGESWSDQASGTTESLYSINFTDENTGIISGSGGVILKTTNAGMNWTIQPSSTTETLYSVYLADANFIIAVGNNSTILLTNDGGTNWYKSPPLAYLCSVKFIDQNIGYATGYDGTILKTTNGGISWFAQSSGTDESLNSVFFTDTNTIYITGGDPEGEASLIKTTNGGVNWVNISPVTGILGDFSSVFFTNYDTGYVVGTYYFDMYPFCMIYKTTNSGLNWVSQLPPLTYCCSIYSVYFTDDNNGYAIGYGAFKSTNGGTNWVHSYLNGNSLDFTNATEGFLVGYYGEIRNTTDSGLNWTLQNSGTGQTLNSVDFIDNSIGYVAGHLGTILKTTNAGTNWSPQTSGTTQRLNSVCFLDANTGYAVGNGTILKTTNGGVTIPTQIPSTPTGPNALCINPSNAAYTTTAINDATSYVWEINPPGAGLITGNWLNAIVDWNDTFTGTAQITVKGHNDLGDGPPSLPCFVDINSPPTPTITQNLSVLTSDASSGNQWYLDGSIIPGATNQSYICSVNGAYSDIVTLNGCSSDTSNIITIINVGIEFSENNKIIKVYPNPVNNELIIEIKDNFEKTNFEILNATGQVVFEGNVTDKIIVKTTSFVTGIYVIKFENGKTFEFRKILKE